MLFSLRRLALLVGSVAALAGCDPAPSDATDRIESTYGDSAVPYVADVVGGQQDASPAAFPDGGGTFDPPDGANTVGAAFGCSPSDCGTAPASLPTCYDGTPAAAVCARFLNGTCTWQLQCGP